MLYSSCSTYCSTPFAWLIVPLLLFNLLFHVQHGVWLLLFSLLFHLSCSTCCSTPFIGPIVMFLLFNLLLLIQHGVPLLLFDLLLHFSCSTYYFACLVQPSVFAPFARPLVQRCYSYSSYFKLVFSPLYVFCKHGLWKNYPNLSSSNQTWKVRVFVFNLCLLMDFFNYSFFIEMVVDNVFICCAQELFEHCRFNYTHFNSLLRIAFHLHNCIIYFFNTLHLCFSFSIACKCLSWLSCSWWNIILAKNIFISNFFFKVGNILAKNGGIMSKWKINFDRRKSNQWKWNVHWRTCGKRRKWKCANEK